MKIFRKIALLSGLIIVLTLTNAVLAKPSLISSLQKMALSTAEGKIDSLASVSHYKASVFIFFSSECPISNSYMALLDELSTEFAKNNIIFYGVIADPGVKADDAKKFADEFAFKPDILMDSDQVLAKLIGAHITPEVFVLSSSGKIEYSGRIDDRYIALGKGRMKARHNDLRNALTSIAEGKKVKTPRTKVIGCWIPGIGK